MMKTKTPKTKRPNLNALDLTQRPPRSPRQRLGGYAILPRALDKGRATIAGKQGEYHFENLDVILELANEEGLKVFLQVYMDSAPR